jgi:hypothetical protein
MLNKKFLFLVYFLILESKPLWFLLPQGVTLVFQPEWKTLHWVRENKKLPQTLTHSRFLNYFQGKRSSRLKFYRLDWATFFFHKKTQYTTPAYKIMFNKNLPEEIILKIVSYLPLKDLINCGISKLFLPVLLDTPWFLNKLNTYVLHLIGMEYYFKSNIFTVSALIPIFLNQQCYFGVDTSKLNFLADYYNLFRKSGYQLFPNLNILVYMLEPFENYLDNSKAMLLVQSLSNYAECHSQCPCLKFFETYVPPKSLENR